MSGRCSLIRFAYARLPEAQVAFCTLTSDLRVKIDCLAILSIPHWYVFDHNFGLLEYSGAEKDYWYLAEMFEK